MKGYCCSQWKDGFRSDSGPSRGDSCRRTIRPKQALTDTLTERRDGWKMAVRLGTLNEWIRQQLISLDGDTLTPCKAVGGPFFAAYAVVHEEQAFGSYFALTSRRRAKVQ